MLFFDGRLLITPQTVSKVDDTALANRNLTVGNVAAFIGSSVGGKPKTALPFSNPTDADAALVSGDLRDMVVKAFAPSAETNAPASVIAMRVNPATQSTATLLDAVSASSIDLVSRDYGANTQSIGYKVENGTSSGRKLTVQQGGNVYSQDNVGRRVFSVVYGGGEVSAVIGITNSVVTLNAPSSTQVASIDLTVFKTIQQLVDYINTVADFTAAVLDNNGEQPSLNAIDNVSGQSVLTEYDARADQQAAIDWFNSAAQDLVIATKHTGSGKPPTPVVLTLLTGGVNGSIANQDWSDCFAELQGADCQWVTPLSSDAAIHAMAAAHVQYMSTFGRRERRAFVGGATGVSRDAAIAAAKAINNDRVAYCWPAHYDFNKAGVLELRSAYKTAAVVCAAFAASEPGDALTNKSLAIEGLETNPKNPTDTDLLIQGGVLAIENTPTGYRVVKSISTWLTNANFNRVEVSVGAAVDFAIRSVRQALDVLRGKRGSPTLLAEALGIVTTTLGLLAVPQPQGPGVLVGDANNPAFRKIDIKLEGDVLRVQFECSPVIPVNYIAVTMVATPFSATVSA